MLRPILLFSLLLAALYAAPTLQEMQQEQRIALIVANGNYANAPLPDAPKEAVRMRDFLKQHGFETLYYENADKRTFIKALRELALRTKAGGIALFYYYGHALQQGGTNFLVPYEAPVLDERSIRYETINLSNILDKLSKMPCRTAIALLDTPFGNPFGKRYEPEKPGLAPMKAQRKTSIFLATQPGKKSDGGFTTRFIKAMQTQGVSLEHGSDTLEQGSKPSQRPHISIDPGTRFYFILPASLSLEEPAPKPRMQPPARSFG